MVLLVIRNLISNVIKFTPNLKKIEILSEISNNFIKIPVVDNTLGIEPERVDKLFTINKKVSTTGTINEYGNGLGLILCKEFVERNGGKITVESERGFGTTVSFTLHFFE
ncbi:MAG: sensor histidine kinase [Bacteroidetes bacterium]|nr:sensor histidine kinase [Bacteroidota bacterium]